MNKQAQKFFDNAEKFLCLLVHAEASEAGVNR